MSAYPLLLLLAEVVEKRNRALMRGGWNYDNRMHMIRNWDSYFTIKYTSRRT